MFHAVIMDKLTIEQSAILQIQRDAEKSVEKIKKTVMIYLDLIMTSIPMFISVSVLSSLCYFLICIYVVMLDEINSQLCSITISNLHASLTMIFGHNKNKKDLHVESCGINHFAIAINSSCVLVTESINMIRFCGYSYAIFNTIMMYFILEGKLPMTITSIIPLVLSLIGDSIPPTHIIFFGVIESMQLFIGFTIISVGFFSLVYSENTNV